jgi:hypothetical protein
MKKFIFLSLTTITCIFIGNAQNKSYVSIEYGATITGMSNSIANNMKANGFGDRMSLSLLPFFDLTVTNQYPITDARNGNYKIRYGYNIKTNTSIEAGFGHIYQSSVEGADASAGLVNALTINCNLSTAYAAYMWKNKKGNTAIGVGPAVSFCTITQGSSDFPGPLSSNTLSNKSYVLPGVIFTGYWNFVNRKNWFMGLRSDMTITTAAKTEEVIITNPADKNFMSVCKSASTGAVMNTISLSAGIKF